MGLSSISKAIGKVHWPLSTKRILGLDDIDKIRKMLRTDYYIILTRRPNYLSTYAIGVATKYLIGKFGYYSHVLMNLEDDVEREEDFRLIEATGSGVHYSTPGQVFDGVNAVCLLRPKWVLLREWTIAMDKVRNQLGKPYDNLFDLSNDQALSCVELIEIGLRNLPDYKFRFRSFDEQIARAKNIVPQMFRDCPDFQLAFEIKKDRDGTV